MASPEISNDGTVFLKVKAAQQQGDEGPLFVPAEFSFPAQTLEQCDVLSSNSGVPSGRVELDLRSGLGRVGTNAYINQDSLVRKDGGYVGEGAVQFLLRDARNTFPVFEAFRREQKKARIAIGRLLWFPEDAEPLNAMEIQGELEDRLALGTGSAVLPDGTVRLPLAPGVQFSDGVNLLLPEDWERFFEHGRPELDRFQKRLGKTEVEPHLRQFDLRAIQIALRERLFAWIKRSAHVQGLNGDVVQHVAARFIGDRSVGMQQQHLRHVELWMEEPRRVNARDTSIDLQIFEEKPTPTMVQSAGIPASWVASQLHQGSVTEQYMIENKGLEDIRTILRQCDHTAPHVGALAGVRGVEWISQPQHASELPLYLRKMVSQYGKGGESRPSNVPQLAHDAASRVANLAKFEGHAYHRMSLFTHTLPPVRELEEMGHKGVRAVFCTNLSGVPTEGEPDLDIGIPYERLKRYAKLSQEMQMGIYWVPDDRRETRIRKLRGHLFVDVAKLDAMENVKTIVGVYCSSTPGMEDMVHDDLQRTLEAWHRTYGNFAVATGASTGLMRKVMSMAPFSIGISTIIPNQYPDMRSDALLVLPRDEIGERQNALSEHIHLAMALKGADGTAYEAFWEALRRRVNLTPFHPVPCVDFCYDPAKDPGRSYANHQWLGLQHLTEAYSAPFAVPGREQPVRMTSELSRHIFRLTGSMREAAGVLQEFTDDPVEYMQSLPGLTDERIRSALLMSVQNAQDVSLRLPPYMRAAYQRYLPEQYAEWDPWVWEA